MNTHRHPGAGCAGTGLTKTCLWAGAQGRPLGHCVYNSVGPHLLAAVALGG